MSKSGKKAASAAVAPKYLSPQEAEILTGVSMWTWRRKAYSGEVESLKIGTRLYLPVAEINRVIAEGTRPRVDA